MAKIMIVDDEPDFVSIVSKMLELEGYQVSGVNSGNDFFKRFQEENPDLVLMDIMMPETNGWDVCKKIKEDEKSQATPVAMLSVRSKEEDQEKSFKYSHCDAHINKPINKQALLNTIDWLLLNVPKKHQARAKQS